MNIAEGLSNQIQRVTELRQAYVDIGPAGQFGLTMIDNSLKKAHNASGSNDVTAVLQAYTELKDIK